MLASIGHVAIAPSPTASGYAAAAFVTGAGTSDSRLLATERNAVYASFVLPRPIAQGVTFEVTNAGQLPHNFVVYAPTSRRTSCRWRTAACSRRAPSRRWAASRSSRRINRERDPSAQSRFVRPRLQPARPLRARHAHRLLGHRLSTRRSAAIDRCLARVPGPVPLKDDLHRASRASRGTGAWADDVGARWPARKNG